jgi:hypothetical protein
MKKSSSLSVTLMLALTSIRKTLSHNPGTFYNEWGSSEMEEFEATSGGGIINGSKICCCFRSSTGSGLDEGVHI